MYLSFYLKFKINLISRVKELKQKDKMLFCSQNNPPAHSTTAHPPHTPTWEHWTR